MSIIKSILNWVRRLTTGKDNKTPDAIRIGSILIGAQFLLLAGWHVLVLEKDFDPAAYGTGAAAVLAATGAALGMAARTQPE